MSASEIKRVLKETLAYIQHHRLGAGDRLPSERDLAARFGVGRGAVREALTALETVRLLERRRNSGFYLRDASLHGSVEAMVLSADFGVPLTRQEVTDAVEMRRILELEAARLACARRTDADLEALRAALAEAEVEIAAGRPIGDQDVRFHLALVAATHNEVFTRLVNSFYLLSRARREAYFRAPAQCRRSHAEHRAIFDALAARDARAAVERLEKHFKGVESFWLATLAERPGAPGT
jgi:DNA-binding FadR family transcriptional regulator